MERPWWNPENLFVAASRWRALRLLAAVAVASWSLAAAALVLGWIVPGAALGDPGLGDGGRAALFACEYLATSALVLALTALYVPVTALTERIGRRWRRVSAVANGLLVASLAILLAVYAASWGMFWGVGTFLDGEVVGFMLVNPGQVWKHLLASNPMMAWAFPSAIAVGTIAVRAIVTGRALGPPRWWSVFSGAFAASVAVAAVLSLHGNLVTAERSGPVDEPSGLRTTEGKAWRVARNTRAGPLTHLVWTGIDRGKAMAGGRLKLPEAPSRPDVVIQPRPYVDPATWAAAVAAPARPPSNVIVLLVESLRPDVLRGFGGSRDVMPALDALAERSMRFHRTYSQASHSDYADLCPLGSQYPLRGVVHHYYPPVLPYPRVLLHDLLEPLGYRTAVVSSQNESWGNMHNYLVTSRLGHFFDSRSRAGDSIVDEEDVSFAKWSSDLGLAGKLDDRVTIDEAIRWISESERPFYVYVNLQNSHFPYRLPAGYPPRFAPHLVDFPYEFANYPREKVDVVRNRYDNSLAYVDAQIARLLGFLERSGRLDRTLLVVTGDTGQAFMEHGFTAHAGPLFDEVVRVPMIIHGPGIVPRDVYSLAEHIDVPPTLLGLLGLPPFPGFQGGDLLAPGDEEAFLVVQTPRANQVAVVAGSHKLIYDYGEDRYLLFDLANDPGERNDLAGSEPILRRELAGRLQAWLDVQLDYYAAVARQQPATQFPPVVLPGRRGDGGARRAN